MKEFQDRVEIFHKTCNGNGLQLYDNLIMYETSPKGNFNIY